MGNESSSEGNDNSSGMNEYCYQTGFDHGSDASFDVMNGNDPIGDALAAAPCTLNSSYNESYAQGYVDGNRMSGVSSGDNCNPSNHHGFCHNNIDSHTNLSISTHNDIINESDFYNGNKVMVNALSHNSNSINHFMVTVEGYTPNATIGTLRVFIARKFQEVTGINNQLEFKVQNYGHPDIETKRQTRFPPQFLNYKSDNDLLSLYDVRKGDKIIALTI